METDSDLAGRLASFCTRALTGSGECSVRDVRRLSDGWESEMYSFTVQSEDRAARDLVLRIYPGSPVSRPGRKCEREYNVMRKLHESGYPVPRVFCMEKDSALFGSPFLLMEKIDGVPFHIFFEHAPADARHALHELFVGLLARLHNLDWQPFWEVLSAPGDRKPDPSDTRELIAAELAMWRDALVQLGEAGYEGLMGWLDTRLAVVAPVGPSLMHMDYHVRNVLMTADARPYVIDWPSAAVGDYRFDLAWSLVHTDPAGEQDSLSLYKRLSGRDLKDLDIFRVLAWARRTLSIVISVRHGAETLGMRPGAENTMKKSAGHLERMYRALVQATGLRLPGVESLLAELGRPI
jgi:aminoglycoside phosphotransferase (APT) family kinase protein